MDPARAGEVDPNLFGIFDMWGLPFIAGNVISDFACLNKVELLPWDGWGMMTGPHDPLDEHTLAVIDDVAALATSDDTDGIRDRYAYDEGLRVQPTSRATGTARRSPSTWTSDLLGPVELRLGHAPGASVARRSGHEGPRRPAGSGNLAGEHDERLGLRPKVEYQWPCGSRAPARASAIGYISF